MLKVIGMKIRGKFTRYSSAVFVLLMTLTFTILMSFAARAGVDNFEKRWMPQEYEKGMHVIITGATGPWDVQGRGGSSVAVIVDGQLIQFDMGSKTLEHLQKSGINPNRIDYLFFTHLHIDHITDFVEYSYVYAPQSRVKYFGPRYTKEMVEATLDVQSVHRKDHDALGLPKFREVPIREISEGGVVLDTDKFFVTATPTVHHASANLKSYAYRVDSKYGSVVISGDTVPTPNVVELAMGADLLVHESASVESDNIPSRYKISSGSNPKTLVRLEDDFRVFPTDMPRFHQHSSSKEVGKIANQAKVKKLVIYHYVTKYGLPADRVNDEIVKSEYISSIKENYGGLIVMGEPRMVFEIGSSLR